jgi:D-cysteine desulfhydrase family pyridoxal phosphate-dependent enzyme
MNWVSLGILPTPLEPMRGLTKELGGPELWIKRDDQTGLATGGNKTRKLEYQLGDALSQGANHLVTLGGPQSNHCRQTAAAAARLGLGCTLVLGGPPPTTSLGNLLLDELLGAEIVFAGDQDREAVAIELVKAKLAEGKKPYFIPLGASTPIGSIGYVKAMQELLDQCLEHSISFNRIVLASSSAGTQAGLVLGAAVSGFGGRILGISIDAARDDLESRVVGLARDAGQLIGTTPPISRASVEVSADYLGAGYAVVGELERDAIRTVARAEGLLLDPVYTGRAMGGLIDLIGKGSIGAEERVLFWHTGGVAALSAFSTPLSTAKT